jgi:predicted aminopeptidase
MGQVSSREAYPRSGAAAFAYRVSAGGQDVSVSGATASEGLWFRIVLGGRKYECARK